MIKTTKPGRDGTVRVTFALPVDEPSGAVSVVGNFNDWNPFAHPLRRRANRIRSAAVTVQAGTTLHFRYLAEGGVWFDDQTVIVPDGQDRRHYGSNPGPADFICAAPSRVTPLFAAERAVVLRHGRLGRLPAASSEHGVV